jgi:phenylalanyl-tRNA synthetase beta chain
MPTISVSRSLLLSTIQQPTSTDDEFDELCFQFGIELDEIVVEPDGSVTYKIDIPANRYDLLCLEGLSRGLLCFLGLEPVPNYRLSTEPATIVQVSPSTLSVRPFIVCAILRDIQFTEASYASFLSLQEHLHRNLCRRRVLVAIGTHDLDSIQLPVRYDALPPQDIQFHHLFAKQDAPIQNARQVLEEFRQDPERTHLTEYTDIIFDKPLYPVVLDGRNQVLSLPPVINSRYSRMSVNTHNVFIECTATDLTKAKIVLDTMVCMFARYCKESDFIHTVQVAYPNGFPPTVAASEENKRTNSIITPCMFPQDLHETTVSVKDVQSILGLQDISGPDMCRLLQKMQLTAHVNPHDETQIICKVPPTRADILHGVDLIEDVAIAYGFNKIPESLPPSIVPGKELPINQMCDLLRQELAFAGYMEILTFGLCSIEDNFKHLGRENDFKTAVTLGNPKTIEYQIARSSLLPGLLKTLEEHRTTTSSSGIRLFEISDVVLLDPTQDTGARNVRRCAVLYGGPTAGMEFVHGVLDRVMQLLNVVPSESYSADGFEEAKLRRGKNATFAGMYSIEPFENGNSLNSGAGPNTYFKGKGTKVMWYPPAATTTTTTSTLEKPIEIGTMGILHPLVLKAFKIPMPVSVFEITLEYFVDLA